MVVFETLSGIVFFYVFTDSHSIGASISTHLCRITALDKSSSEGSLETGRVRARAATFAPCAVCVFGAMHFDRRRGGGQTPAVARRWGTLPLVRPHARDKGVPHACSLLRSESVCARPCGLRESID